MGIQPSSEPDFGIDLTRYYCDTEITPDKNSYDL